MVGSVFRNVKIRNNGLLSEARKGLTTSRVGNFKFDILRVERQFFQIATFIRLLPLSRPLKTKLFRKAFKDLFLTVGNMGKSYGLRTGGETGTGDHNEPLFIKHVIRKAVLSQRTCSYCLSFPFFLQLSSCKRAQITLMANLAFGSMLFFAFLN